MNNVFGVDYHEFGLICHHSHVHVCQQYIVRGWVRVRVCISNKKDEKKIKGTTKPLMANLDIAPNCQVP